MKAKRLPCINEQLDSQILLLEEMVNSFSSKWKIFIEDKTFNNIDKINELNNEEKLEIKTDQNIEDYSRQILTGVENN